MKRFLVGIATATLVFVTTAAVWPEVINVTAKQRHPWNGKVDIYYTVVGNMKDFELSVSASDKSAGTNYVAEASAVSGDTGSETGEHHVVWDLNAQGLAFKSTDVVFRVSYVLPNPQYCVIDLSTGLTDGSCPVSYMAEPPSGGFNAPEYKTTQLALRLVEPGSFVSAKIYNISITKPFYIGIFEVTQKQYELVMGKKPSNYSYGGDARPVEKVSWAAIRGSSSNWPKSSTVASGSFLGRLQAWTGMKFDLPTEAQWEYACRAGTTSDFNNGDSNESALARLGRYDGNRLSGGGYQQHTTVGSYTANAWGIYDMHGNVLEWCLDWYGSWTSAMSDPKGAQSGTERVIRGGSWYGGASYCTSSYRNSAAPTTESDKIGFRIARTLSE